MHSAYFCILLFLCPLVTRGFRYISSAKNRNFNKASATPITIDSISLDFLSAFFIFPDHNSCLKTLLVICGLCLKTLVFFQDDSSIFPRLGRPGSSIFLNKIRLVIRVPIQKSSGMVCAGSKKWKKSSQAAGQPLVIFSIKSGKSFEFLYPIESTICIKWK